MKTGNKGILGYSHKKKKILGKSVEFSIALTHSYLGGFIH